MDVRLKTLMGTALLSLAIGGAAYAGGFSRGTADTDILYEDGNFNMRSGVTYVSPHREFSRNPNPRLVGTRYTEDYVIPSAAIKINLSDNLRCAGTFVNNIGGSAKYEFPAASGKVLEEFTTYETAATCALGFDVGPGRLWVLGGGFGETLDYLRKDSYAAVGLGEGVLDLEGQKYGYRIGAAYEIPEIALRGQIIYRSGTDYGAEGTATAPRGVLYMALKNQGVPDVFNPFAGGNPLQSTPLDAYGVGSLPQSVELKFQTGIAPDWLAFGAVKWTDWSSLTRLDVRSVEGDMLLLSDEYYWRDGWTVTGGLGHKFNDTFSGLVSLTWDRGVSTGYDLQGDVYTAAVGVTMKDRIGGELRGGVGLSYLASVAETKYGVNPNITDSDLDGRHGDQAVKAGYAFAFNLSYSLKW
ncbi:MAG: outer membrane protein transport protein [Mesorhizobium sp.]